MAMFLVTGLFGGALGGVASAAGTSSLTLTVKAGGFAVKGNALQPYTMGLGDKVTGSIDPTTGAMTGVTLPQVGYHLAPSPVNTETTETVILTQLTPGASTGQINSTGDVSITATVSILLTIHFGGGFHCLTSPVHLIYESTSPYSTSTHTVSLRATHFTIPDFQATSPAGSCGLAEGIVTGRFAGSTGNVATLTLQGTLPLPPPPAKPTTTLLTVSPVSPVVVGTKVTLTASVSATRGTTPAPTGQITFKSGATIVGSASLSTNHGTDDATFTTTSLPAKPTQSLTAVYSGDTKYASSTSSGTVYSVQPKPSISTSLPVTAIRGTSTPTTFTVYLTNPSIGKSWTNLKLQLRLRTVTAQAPTNVTYQYENDEGTWCTIPFRGGGAITGTFVGLTGPCVTPTTRTPNRKTHFSLPANTSLTIPFRIKFATGANVGRQTALFTLVTVTVSTPTGPVITPLTTATHTGTPINAPYATGHIQVNPATKYPVTMSMTPSTTVPLGYALKTNLDITHPTNPGDTVDYPTPTGTVRLLVTGHTLSPPLVVTANPGTLEYKAQFSTNGLSVGTHTVTAIYSGDGVYDPNQVTATFKVIAGNPGTAFQCTTSDGGTYAASAAASAALPTTTSTGSVTANLLAMTVYLDSVIGPQIRTEPVTHMHISFAPGGSVTVATAGKVGGSGDTLTASVSHASATISSITGSPGTVVPIAVSAVSFDISNLAIRCSPVAQSAPLGSVIVSGITLSASPTSPVSPGTVVTLKATPVPATKGGQVTFFDGTKALGTVLVPASGATKGVAKLTLQPLLGTHTYTAQWSGTLPASTSNTVAYAVETAPAVTKQPSPPTANLGQPLMFTAAATGSPVPTVAWQQSTDGGSTWAPAVGTVTTKATGTTTSTTLTIGSATKADGSTQFRAVFTNSAGTATTNAATPTVVIPPTVVTQPASQSVVVGSTGTFTASVNGTIPSVQWQVSTDGGKSWSNAPGTPKNTIASRTTLTSTYTTPATATANNGNQYRAHFSNGAGSATSNAATLTVTTTPPPPVPPAPPATGTGYNLVASNGSVFAFGNAQFYGSMGGKSLSAPIVGTASTPGDGGYWLVGSDGGIFAFGNAQFYGSMGGQPLNQPIVGMAATPTGGGYWEVASDGGIFAFGNATFYGSMGGKSLNKPIVGIASTPDGKGYWLVASDGGIFAFGDATFSGSTGSMALNKPIVSMVPTSTGGGYWLVAADGGVFSFGNAGFFGTVAGTTTSQIVSLVPTGDNGGYWETAANGQVFQFGDATLVGTAFSQTLGTSTIVGMSQ